MSRATRRVAWLCAILIGISLALGYLHVGGTFAVFDGQTTNAGSAFAAGWVDPPTSLQTPTASGYDVQLAWTPGTHGPVTGQTLLGHDNGASSSCGGVSYSTVATLGASTSSYTHQNVGSGAANGDWYCYALESTTATAWTAEATFAAVRVGLAATALATANGGAAESLDDGDTVTITFNQATSLASGTVKVCAVAGGPLILGDTSAGSTCAAGDGYGIGELSGPTIAATSAFTSSTLTVSTSAPWTVRVTLGGGSATGVTNATGTFTASGSVTSSATTDQASACTAANTTCRPTAATAF